MFRILLTRPNHDQITTYIAPSKPDVRFSHEVEDPRQSRDVRSPTVPLRGKSSIYYSWIATSNTPRDDDVELDNNYIKTDNWF